MKPDPQIRSLLERAAARVPVDAEAAFERVMRAPGRRDGRRMVLGLVAAVVAAALVLVAVVIVSQTGDDQGFVAPGEVPSGRLTFGRRAFGVEVPRANELVTVNLGTGEQTEIEADGTVTWASWSPDGSSIAYTAELDGGSRYALVVARADGTEPRTIVEHDKGDPTLPGPDFIWVAWSPDGSRLAYSGRTIFRGRTVSVLDADGSNERVLDGHWENVSWSPDGQYLLLRGWLDDAHADRFDIYRMRPDGGDVVQLTDDDLAEFMPTWSPDGSAIAFARSDAAGDDSNVDVFVMDADGANVRRLTGAGFDAVPVWSPDGEWIAFASDRAATAEERAGWAEGVTVGPTSIYAMRPDGSDIRLVVDGGDGVVFPFSWKS